MTWKSLRISILSIGVSAVRLECWTVIDVTASSQSAAIGGDVHEPELRKPPASSVTVGSATVKIRHCTFLVGFALTHIETCEDPENENEVVSSCVHEEEPVAL